MTDRAQFEAMLEALINEDQATAKEIFHNIVVGKSREIYEELLENDFSQDQGLPEQYASESDEEAEEPAMEETDEEETDDAEDDSEETDDAEDDSEESPFGDDEEAPMGDEGGDMEDRVMDLEDALEDLKAEFEQLMAGEEGEDMGMADMDSDMDNDMGMDEPAMGGEDELSGLMEYVNKVGGATYDKYGKMGDNGVNTRSIVAGKNDMGGTTANIAKSFSTEKGGTQGGLLKPTTQEENFGNINVPGANAGKTGFEKKEPGHGAEKKGAGEKADNTNSMLNGAPKRAK